MQGRYIASMIGLALVDLGFTGAYVAVAGQRDEILEALATSLVMLVIVNGAGAWILFRPIARVLRPDAPTATEDQIAAAARRLRLLPRFSAGWLCVVGIAYCLVIFSRGVFTPPQSVLLPPLDPEILIAALVWFTAAYAYYFGFYGFFAASDCAARARRVLFARYGRVVEPSVGSLIPKLALVVVTLTVMPATVILLDLTVFRDVRALQGLQPEEAVMLDLLALLIAAAISLIFVVRSLTLPISCLIQAVRRVGENDLSAGAPVLGDDEIGSLASNFNVMVAGLRERERFRETFGKFVAPAVADRILAEGASGDGRLAGEMRMATIVFTDIEGFTGLSERISPEQMIDMLNDYFDLICGPIEETGGTITNFIGDAVQAVYNVPQSDPSHARNAIRAALAIQDRLADAEFPAGIRLRTRIGIHSGPVVAGTVGSRNRLGYTVYGDAVNLAARLEPLNKEFGTKILISEATAGLAWDIQPAIANFACLGEVPVRGRAAPVTVYSVERAVAVAGGVSLPDTGNIVPIRSHRS